MGVQTGQALTALVIGLPSFLLGYLAYRRSRKVDAVAAQSGIVTETRAGTAQIIEGLNLLVDNLQADNTTFREDIRYLTSRLDAITKERDELRQRLNRLNRKYGEGDQDIPDTRYGG